jgi:hypothetical protein
VRIAVDGSMEYAVAPVTGNDMDPPFSILEVLTTSLASVTNTSVWTSEVEAEHTGSRRA